MRFEFVVRGVSESVERLRFNNQQSNGEGTEPPIT